MILFGILLLVVAAILGLIGVWGALATDDKITFSYMGNMLDMHPLVMFCLGAVAVACLWWGLGITGWGAQRKVRDFQERRQLERKHEQQRRELAETQRELAARKDAEDAAAERRAAEEAREAQAVLTEREKRIAQAEKDAKRR